MIPFLHLLAGGAPDEPDTLDELGGPGPWTALEAVFREIAGDALGELRDRREWRDGDERTGTDCVEGVLGNERSGLTYVERAERESSMFPVDCRAESFGLPGLDLAWSWGLAQVNVAGRVGFRHGKLLVRFRSAEVRSRFAVAWRQALRRDPVFAPAPIQPATEAPVRARLLAACSRELRRVIGHEQGKFIREGMRAAEALVREAAASDDSFEWLVRLHDAVDRRGDAMTSDPDDERSDGYLTGGLRTIQRAVREELDDAVADEAAAALQAAFPDRAAALIDAWASAGPAELALAETARALRSRRADRADELIRRLEALRGL